MVVSTRLSYADRWGKALRRLLLVGWSAAAAAGAGGCVWDSSWFAPKRPELAEDREALVLRGDHLEAELPPEAGTGAAELASAHEAYRRGDYGAAERLFHRVANNTKNTAAVAEEACYYEAECLRLQGRYPKAADTYNRLVNDFPSGAYRDLSLQRMFFIANYWLDDTRKEMDQQKEKADGKRWWVWNSMVHFDKSKPFLDQVETAGRALDLEIHPAIVHKLPPPR